MGGSDEAGAVTLDQLTAWVRAFAAAVHENRDELTALDSAIGDADHGSNLDRGMTAVLAKLDATPPETAAALFKTTGMTLVSTVGGASGPLYGTLFLRLGTSLGDVTTADTAALAAAFAAGLEGVRSRGKAEVGDKTMVDALTPAVQAMQRSAEEGSRVAGAVAAAAAAAEQGRDSTTPLQARKGRASYLGERSIGHLDPGATSSALLVATAASSLR